MIGTIDDKLDDFFLFINILNAEMPFCLLQIKHLFSFYFYDIL